MTLGGRLLAAPFYFRGLPMPTLVATKGASNANSYATVAEADTYLDNIYGADEWATLEDDDKARLLITATKMIDRLSINTTNYGSCSSAQALNFPLVDAGGNEVGFAKAAEAAIIQAFYLYLNQDTISEGKTMAVQGIKSETIGPTNKTITGFNPFRKFDSQVFVLLKDYLDLDFVIPRG